MNEFSIGQRVSYAGNTGVICSSVIQVTSPSQTRRVRKTYFVYLVLFDKLSNGEAPVFSNFELGYSTVGAMPVNEALLTSIKKT